jgi:hypothetical protein
MIFPLTLILSLERLVIIYGFIAWLRSLAEHGQNGQAEGLKGAQPGNDMMTRLLKGG